jgi:serine/threonine-protein kinase
MMQMGKLPPDKGLNQPPWTQGLVEQFKEAWRVGPPPSLEAVLPAGPEERRQVLRQLAPLDLEYRLKEIEQARVEVYLQRFPELADDADTIRTLVATEFALRGRQEPPTLAEFQRRFPGYSDVLVPHLSTVDWGGASKGVAAGSPQSTVDETDPYTAGGHDPLLGHGLAGRGQRFRRLRLHARGGLGEVWVAEDTELGREVALKLIQERHRRNPESRRRFLREAEVTGRLQHPGIVPVYGMGEDADGAPCYAMHFIEGEDLQAAIRRFHEASPPGQDAGRRSLELRQLLTRFVVVCNTIAYAHSRGVLHRDLKPANIMLGRYGETLVVDWGLGKLWQRTPEAEAGTAPPAMANDAEAEGGTQEGQQLGTPAYMSPEQAAGDVGQLGPPTDVYGLGATLYAILTGQPPVSGRGVAEIFRRVQQGDFAKPRQVKLDTPLALEAICLKAMALEPQERYASAEALAADIEHWLADEPITARRASRSERLGRWLRRHRTGVSMTAAAVLVAVLCLGAASGMLFAAYRDASQQRDRAKARLELALGAVDQFYTKASGNPELRTHGLEQLRQQLLESAVAYYRRFVEDESNEPQVRAEQARSYRRMADLISDLGRLDEAEAAYLEGRDIAADLAARYPKEPAYPRDLARILASLSGFYQIQGKRDTALKTYAEALATYEPLLQRSPDDHGLEIEVASCLEKKGLLHMRSRETDQAEKTWLRSQELREHAAAAEPDNPAYQNDLARIYSNLGSYYVETGREELSEKNYKRAREIFAKLAADQPAEPQYQNALGNAEHNLGYLYINSGRAKLAEPAYKASLDVRRRLAETHPLVLDYQRNVGFSYSNLGDVYQVTGRFEEAVKAYEESRKVHQKLADAYPRIPEYQQALASNYTDLARCFRDLDRTDQAEAAWKQSCERLGRLSDTYPDQPDFRHRLANSYNDLGIMYLDQSRFAECDAAWQKARGLFQKLAQDHPALPIYRRDLAGAEDNFGVLHRAIGRLDLAEKAHQKAVEDFQRLVDAEPKQPLYQADLAMCLGSLGKVYLNTGRWGPAETAFGQALELLQKLVGRHPDVSHYQALAAGAICNRADVARLRGDLAGALDLYGRAQEQLEGVLRKNAHDPHPRTGLARAHLGRGVTLARLGQAKESDEALASAAKFVDAPEVPELLPVRLLIQAYTGRHAGIAELVGRVMKDKGLKGNQLYELSCGCAVAAATAAKDGKLTPAERARASDALADAAIAFLRRAQTAGFFLFDAAVQQVARETDLAPLRSRPKFQDLLRDLAAQAKKH